MNKLRKEAVRFAEAAGWLTSVQAEVVNVYLGQSGNYAKQVTSQETARPTKSLGVEVLRLAGIYVTLTAFAAAAVGLLLRLPSVWARLLFFVFLVIIAIVFIVLLLIHKSASAGAFEDQQRADEPRQKGKAKTHGGKT